MGRAASKPRPASRGNRKARRQNAESRRRDSFYANGVLTHYDRIREKAQAEAIRCAYCGDLVHPDNLVKHNHLYHLNEVVIVDIENQKPLPEQKGCKQVFPLAAEAIAPPREIHFSIVPYGFWG